MARFSGCKKKMSSKEKKASDAASANEAQASSESGNQTTSQPATTSSASSTAMSMNGIPVFPVLNSNQGRSFPDNLLNILQMYYSLPRWEASTPSPTVSNTAQENSASAGNTESTAGGGQPPSHSNPSSEATAAVPTLVQLDSAGTTAGSGLVYNTQHTMTMMPAANSGLFLNMESRSLFTNLQGPVFSDINHQITLGGLPLNFNVPARNQR